MKTEPTVAVVIITKNEEYNIKECLESVLWADEFIVVDAQSHDRTVEIARQYTDKVFVRPWPGFGAQKNFGMAQATSEWILILDADERISPELQVEIQARVTRWSPGEPVAYRMPRRNYFYGRWARWGGQYPDWQIQLFRKEAAQYNDVLVHENLLVDGAIGSLDGHLDHYTERRIDDHFKKFSLYTTLAAQEKRKSRKVVYWHDLALRPLVIFFKVYVLKQGFRDGLQGLILGVFASMYTFVKYAKLWELTTSSGARE